MCGCDFDVCEILHRTIKSLNSAITLIECFTLLLVHHLDFLFYYQISIMLFFYLSWVGMIVECQKFNIGWK